MKTKELIDKKSCISDLTRQREVLACDFVQGLGFSEEIYSISSSTSMELSCVCLPLLGQSGRGD